MRRIAFAALAIGLAAPASATDFTIVGQASGISINYAKIEWTRSAGSTEQGVIKFACSNGAVSNAWIYAPRDVATGQASGKRMHKPFTIVKEWGAASPSLAKGSWDLATNKGGKTMATDDWQAISVTGLEAACAAPPAGKVNVHDISVTK